MITTQYDVAFKSAITEIRLIDARLYVLEIFINQAKTRIENDSRVGNDLINSGFSFRDITLEVGTNNLFMPTDIYSLNRLNLSEEVELILSRESLFQIAQAYEVLETYLYNQVADYIRLNNGIPISASFKPASQEFEDIRSALKRMNNRTNNHHLLTILRNNNSIFKAHELDNIYNTNFKEWINLFSEVRHSIIHSRTHPNNYLLENGLSSFEQYFKIKNIDQEDFLFTRVNDAKELLHILGGYMFFIYKAVTDGTFGSETSFKTILHIFSDPYYN